MIHLNVAEGCAPTGRILRELLNERNIRIGSQPESEGVVCWGNGYTGTKPSLNRNATRFNKLEQLQTLAGANLRTVPLMHTPTTLNQVSNYPAFMRKVSHAGGTDIRVALEPDHGALFLRNGWNFATKYIPNQIEYRVWVYRRQHLGTYEKHLARPAEFLNSRRFGANFDNGYAFRIVPSANVPRAAVELATAAVQQLGLDFGAVDILQGRDGNFYILEVNTAPGVEGPDRQVIQALADKIAWWVEHNYLRRTGDETAYVRPARAGAAPRRRTAPAAAPAPVNPDRPSFLPRPGETFESYVARVNA